MAKILLANYRDGLTNSTIGCFVIHPPINSDFAEFDEPKHRATTEFKSRSDAKSWCCSGGAMDTLSGRQVLEDMVERGEMPWRRYLHAPVSVAS
jgi:hypothetical protein